MQENGIRGYCHDAANRLDAEMDLRFICHYQQRDENLIHALQCLRDKRVLALSYRESLLSRDGYSG